MLVALFLVGCDEPVQRAKSEPLSKSTLNPDADPGGRQVKGPAGIELIFETNKAEQKRFLHAIKDLDRLGFWKRLTKGLFAIEMETHPGARSEVGVHLADAALNHTLAGGEAQVVCDIRFYPLAIRGELRIWKRILDLGITPRRWRDYNDNGSFDEIPPKLDDFWSAILAHELSHCLVGPHGERQAQKWEYKTIRRLKPPSGE